jgi:hypothetical protein
MSYKALYKKLSDQIFQIGQKTMEIILWDQVAVRDGAENPNKQGHLPTRHYRAPKRRASTRLLTTNFYLMIELRVLMRPAM